MFGLSTIGAVHTLISVVAVVVALVQLAMSGRINPHSALGKVYVGFTALSCISSFALLKHGFNPGHILGILTLICLAAALIVEAKKFKYWLYIQTGLLSLTLFFSLVPATNETLTRLPINAPLATGPQDPLVGKIIGIFLLLLIIGLAMQFLSIKKANQRSKPI